MPTILIIDDDLTTRLVLQRALSGQGYEIAVAGDGIEGIAKAKELHPALIICDWTMPRLDGLEVCRFVKADPQLCTAFFVLLTSRSAVGDRVRGFDTGADDFLSKPIEVNELQARVRAGLRLQRTNQDLQVQKRMLESELAEAAEYVRSLLPTSLSGKVKIDARFVPSRQLGGDCFDYYWLDPDYLAIYLLDVSGHGLGAALPSIAVLNLLRSQSMDGVNFYQPNLVLAALNEAFQMDNQNDKYFTIWYGVYNRVKRQLIYSSAGHPPAVLLSKSENGRTQVKQLKTSSLPIGMLPDTRFFNQRCEIETASTMYVFSDGIYEIHQSNGVLWGLDAFVQLLEQEKTAIEGAGLDYVLDYVRALNPKEVFDDDLSVLRIHFT